MNLTDVIYGNFIIEESVLSELINSENLQRLRNISSGGYHPAYPAIGSEAMNRYNHSIGVFLLLRKYGAPLEEQIAGLIHDVSHSAFSHTIDYIAVEDGHESQKNHSTQDDNHDAFIKSTDIPAILEKHGFDLSYILDDSNFPLKENDLPDICADRIDYSLRQGYGIYGIIDEEQKNFILEHLVNHNSSFVFDNQEAAKIYAETFWKMDEKHWSGIRSATMFALGGKMFRYAVKKSCVTLNDFFKLDDVKIIEMIKTKLGDDPEIKECMRLLNLPDERFESNPENCIEKVFCKSRKVDPYIVLGSNLKRLSELDNDFKTRLEKAAKFKEYFIREKL